MLKSVITYGAVSAKLHALKGRMLTDRDFERLCQCETLADVGQYLRRTQGYASAMAAMPTGFVSAIQMQQVLRAQLLGQFEGLYRFASASDRKYLMFGLWRTEMDQILYGIRQLLSPGDKAIPGPISQFFKDKCGLDMDALAAATDFLAIKRAAKKSIYAKALEAVPIDPATGLPDYPAADALMRSCWYKKVWSFVTKDYSGMEKQGLIQLIGREADLMNIVNIMRLRQFPGGLDGADALLIPIRYKLKPDTVSALISARDDHEAEEVLRASGWLRHFPKGVQDMDRQYRQRTEAFCRRLLQTTQPNICCVQAYLTLRELECEKLIRLIQAVAYGVDPTEVI